MSYLPWKWEGRSQESTLGRRDHRTGMFICVSMWTEVSAKSWGKWGKCVPACVVGVCSLAIGGWGRMPSVALLWGAEELGELAQWPRASPPHEREAQVCTSLSCAEKGPGSLHQGWGGGIGLSPLQGIISATLTKGGIIHVCMRGGLHLAWSPFHGMGMICLSFVWVEVGSVLTLKGTGSLVL